ncbi:DUF6624 domain-containing protein [Portibacter lacus]|nr:DUF6624 domain-containing protein [Portibacter lacus]
MLSSKHLIIVLLVICAFLKETQAQIERSDRNERYSDMELISMLDAVFRSEQEPITRRDSLIDLYGIESELANEQQLIYEHNHEINEQKIIELLDNFGWPKKEIIGVRGNRTICNVIQHSDNCIRIKYLPMMKAAVMDGNLDPQLLARTEDRIATESGELQIYGGQMKYYPETKSFNVWPVYDPVNIDKRRAEIGLGPIKEFLKNRFNFEWNVEEQLARSAHFNEKMARKR